MSRYADTLICLSVCLSPYRAAFIEAELLKRRGGVPLDQEEDAATIAAKKAAAYDPQEELYAIAEQYRNEQRVRQKGEDDEEGGNVVNSMAMLTASKSRNVFDCPLALI
jgi:hypothetical protein